jgi:hypothetical protein
MPKTETSDRTKPSPRKKIDPSAFISFPPWNFRFGSMRPERELLQLLAAMPSKPARSLALDAQQAILRYMCAPLPDFAQQR